MLHLAQLLFSHDKRLKTRTEPRRLKKGEFFYG
jgi:hypothetical protein